MNTRCLPWGQAWGGATHLQARSPLALATVQSRPVALRPMLPTTVSRTYCLSGGKGGEGEVGSAYLVAPPGWLSLFLGGCSPWEVRAT